MKAIRFNRTTAALLAAAALGAVVTAIIGHPIPDLFAALGLLPLAVGSTVSIGDIAKLLAEQGQSIEQFKAAHSDQLREFRAEFDAVVAKAQRPGASGLGVEGKAERLEQWIDTQTKRAVPVLTHSDSLAALDQKSDAHPSIGRLLRGITLGGRADDAAALADERKALGIASDPSGGYTVAGALASEWIDALRSQMVLSKAGARTLPMEAGSVSIARVTGDPEVFWHTENAALVAGDPTFGAVNLKAKTCVCLVRLSLELSQDSANIEQILQSTIINAMAGAIDSAGLVGVTTDAGAAPDGVFNMTGRNSVTSIGAPTNWDFAVDGMYELMADNVPMERIGALIAHPAVWKKMRKLKTGIASDQTALTMPAEVAALPKLWTTAAPLTGGTTAKGVIADWRDLVFGVRKQISVRVLDQAFMGSNLQIAVLAYARVDFAGVRPQSFCTLEGITV